jgi:hypothetical protein
MSQNQIYVTQEKHVTKHKMLQNNTPQTSNLEWFPCILSLKREILYFCGFEQ